MFSVKVARICFLLCILLAFRHLPFVASVASSFSQADKPSTFSSTFLSSTNTLNTNIDLSNLSSQQGFTITGINAGDRLGNFVSGAGDVNQDGYDDIIIGSNGYPSGRAYIIYGGPSSGFKNITLASLEPSQGFSITGLQTSDQFGLSGSGAGDINHDGYDDMIIGAYGYPNFNSLVLFGAPASNLSKILFSDLNVSQGFTVAGINAGDFTGCSVSSAGDINNDGYDDIMIGAYGYKSDNYNGRAYILFGGQKFNNSVELADISPSQGFWITGINHNDKTGWSVSRAGDVNNDGYGDMIIGAYGYPSGTNTGRAYVIFGGPTSNLSNIDLANLMSYQGFSITGINPNDLTGYSVSGAGDINNDGYDDIILGAYGYPSGTGNGSVYVIYGAAASNFSNIDLENLTSSQGFSIIGVDLGDFGVSVKGAGDVNNDGYDDLIIGADSYAKIGRVYVIYGRATFTGNIDLANLTSTLGFTITGINSNDYTGFSVSGAGDINNDGFDDMIIGACGYPSGTYVGSVYVVFGGPIAQPTAPPTIQPSLLPSASPSESSTSIHPTQSCIPTTLPTIKPSVKPTNIPSPSPTTIVNVNLNLSTLSANQGFSISGIYTDDFTGFSMSSAGDINNDGYRDIIIGAYGYPNNQIVGRAYLIYGGSSLGNISLSTLNSSQGFSITGIADGDYTGYSVCDGGDVNNDGYDDMLIGAIGYPNTLRVGRAYVIYGGPKSSVTNINLADLTPSQGFWIEGINENDNTGSSVSGTGDINGDGYDDILIGALSYSFNTNIGRAYVVYGGPTASFSNLDLANLNASQGFSITGISEGDQTGNWVSGTGDINGDGYNDMLIGASGYPNGDAIGRVYVMYGGPAANLTNIDLSNFNESQGFSIDGINPGDYTGNLVGAGNINGDIYDDIIFGAYGYPSGTNIGRTYVIYGGPSSSLQNISLANLNSSQGFSITGIHEGDFAGTAGEVGDVNNDGYDDLIIGSIGYPSDSNIGRAYVIYGGSSSSLASIDLAALPSSQGFSITGINAGDQTGFAVSAAGDINGDGYHDMVISAESYPAGCDIGHVFVVYGSSTGFNPLLAPTPQPTSGPSSLPTSPSNNPTTTPTIAPSPMPTIPSLSPIEAAPTTSPTFLPSSFVPTGDPSVHPTLAPSRLPTSLSSFPTISPTIDPSAIPTIIPSPLPTIIPSQSPVDARPTFSPAIAPSSFSPTLLPSSLPSSLLTTAPSVPPTAAPTVCPTIHPSIMNVTEQPSAQPTVPDTLAPTSQVLPPVVISIFIFVPGALMTIAGLSIVYIRSYYPQDLYKPFNSTPLTLLDLGVKSISLTVFIYNVILLLQSTDPSLAAVIVLMVSVALPLISLAIFLYRVLSVTRQLDSGERNIEVLPLSSLLFVRLFQKAGDGSQFQRLLDGFIYNLHMLWVLICGLNITLLKLLPWKANPYLIRLEGYPTVFVAKLSLFGDLLCNLCRVIGSILIFIHNYRSGNQQYADLHILFLIFSGIQLLITCITYIFTIALANVKELSIVSIDRDAVIVTVKNAMLESSNDHVSDDVRHSMRQSLAEDLDSNIDFVALQQHEHLLDTVSAESCNQSSADLTLTLDIRKKQLEKLGIQPLEYIALDQLKAEIDSLISQLNNGLPCDEKRLDYLLQCLEVNPEYILEQAEIDRKWREAIADYSNQCLQEMRGYISSQIFMMTLHGFHELTNYSMTLCKRILNKKCLWLIRLHPNDIAKLHIADIESKFTPLGHSLDIVELSAIYAALPVEFANDPTGRKTQWRKSVEKLLKDMLAKKNAGTLSKALTRNDAYKGNAPAFIGRASLHQVEVLKRNEEMDAPSAERLSLKKLSTMSIVQKRKSSLQKSSDSDTNSNISFGSFSDV
jgi:hypothetical protein